MSSIDKLLSKYRAEATEEREKGTYFERVAIAFLKADPVQVEEFEDVWAWADWGPANGFNATDTGIDLVAKLHNEDGFAAIQAKFYAAETRIQKAHIDSFISASGKEPFKRRVIIDTTEKGWSENAEEMLRGQIIPVSRIGLTDLRSSPIDWSLFDTKGEVVLHDKKTPMPHQSDALDAVRKHHQRLSIGKNIFVQSRKGSSGYISPISETVAVLRQGA